MFKSILVAYDASKASAHAFLAALDMAKQLHANLSVLSVAQLPEPAAMVESSAMLELANEHYEKDFNRMRADAQSAGVTAETRVLVGHPAEQIVHYASQCKADLIVMGHRGGSRVREWLLGSVSKRVLSYAPCSVLIVR